MSKTACQFHYQTCAQQLMACWVKEATKTPPRVYLDVTLPWVHFLCPVPCWGCLTHYCSWYLLPVLTRDFTFCWTVPWSKSFWTYVTLMKTLTECGWWSCSWLTSVDWSSDVCCLLTTNHRPPTDSDGEYDWLSSPQRHAWHAHPVDHIWARMTVGG